MGVCEGEIEGLLDCRGGRSSGNRVVPRRNVLDKDLEPDGGVEHFVEPRLLTTEAHPNPTWR